MSQGRLQSVVQRYRGQLAAHEVTATRTLTQAYQRALNALQPELDRLYQQMTDELATGDKLSLSWLSEAQRLETLKKFIIGQMNHYGMVAQLTAQHFQQVGAALGQASSLAQLQAVLPTIGLSFAQASPGAIADLVGATQAGSPLADLVGGFGAEAAENAANALKVGIALGYSVQKVAHDIQEALDIERSRALTIARTELLRAYRSASLEVYRANSDVCGQWLWSASKSGRTCAACLAMDGTLHDLDEDMASHVNCRCSPIPIPSNPAFQIDYQSGSDWFDEQDVEVQQEVLGAKYDGFKNGEFRLDDMVGRSHDDKWGESIYVKSLKQLQAA